MGTIADKLAYLAESKEQIRQAIEGMGVSVPKTTIFRKYAEKIKAITGDATATAANILSGKTAYVKGKKLTGTIPSKAAQSYTPGTVNQTIDAGQYLAGAQTIQGDANLVAENIVSGKTIFGVKGSAVGSEQTVYFTSRIAQSKPCYFKIKYKAGPNSPEYSMVATLDNIFPSTTKTISGTITSIEFIDQQYIGP